MGEKIKLDYSYVFPFINEPDIEHYKNETFKNIDLLVSKKGAGSDFLGWLDLPEKMLNSDEFKDILETGHEIYENADLFVIIGIGGSYLGAKAVAEAIQGPMLSCDDNCPKLLFAGHNICGKWLESVIKEIDKAKSVYVNVISKSGTTTEPGIAFRMIQQRIEKKYGKVEASKRIIATTDAKKGALRQLADRERYRTFVIPDDVGGRFSVLTPVGLLPISGVGIDTSKMLEGALEASIYCRQKQSDKNPAALYSMLRNALLSKGYNTEILVNYEPSMHYFSEWWKQLYGESEGKNGKGIFPASVDFTTDLHSMGQWIQDGQRFIFETVINVNEPTSNLKVPSDKDDPDGLEYLAGKTYFEINKKAMSGTLLAHYEGKVPNLVFELHELDAANIGQLIYVFEFACGVSGYTLGVNPFDQPGVEAYKKNMFALLDKQGKEYEKLKKELEAKIEGLPKGKVTS